jgi:aconitate hydratase
VLSFDLSSVVRNMAGPSNPHARATSDLAAKGTGSGGAGANAGRRGDHRRHHQLHQHQQPAQRDRRRPAGAPTSWA